MLDLDAHRTDVELWVEARRKRVGWVERSETHHQAQAMRMSDGFRKGSTQPTGFLRSFVALQNNAVFNLRSKKAHDFKNKTRNSLNLFVRNYC